MKMNSISKTLKVLQVLALGLLIACADERPTKFPDGEGSDIYDISVFSSEMEVVTGTEMGSKPSYSNKAFYKVENTKTKAPEALKRMFYDLPVLGAPELKVNVKAILSESGLTVYKEVTKAEISLMEQGIAIKTKDNKLLVPIFSYAVMSFGVLAKKKDDYGDTTSTLRLEPTEFSDASHVKVDLNTSKRKLFVLSENIQKELFLASHFENQLVSAENVEAQLGIKLDAKLDDSFISRVSGGHSLDLFLVTTSDSGRLTDLELEAINSGGVTSDNARKCTKEEADLVFKNDASKKDKCVVVLAHQIPVKTVALQLKRDFKGDLTGEIEVKPGGRGILQVVKGTLARSVRSEINFLDSKKVIALDQVRDKEFLFRITIQDSPNEFPFTFAGASGPLEVVKFVITDAHLKVVRTRALTDRGDITDVDKEVLMAIPVKNYIRKIYTSQTGENLAIPRIEYADKDDKDAIAVLDWAVNELDQTVSPMNSLKVCFQGGGAKKEVSSIDHRLKESEGMLNFTLSSDYSAHSFCTNQVERRRWFARGQKNFTFKERFSFKEYVHKTDDPVFNIPLKAQKLLGFGLFTYEKNLPNSNGNIGRLGSRVHLPAVFDIAGGKGIHYVLAGLPEGSSAEEQLERKLIVQATHKVVDDLNKALKLALKGSKFETSKNLISLSIENGRAGEGQSATKGVLGDLDRNYIYYVQKATETPVIGLGGSHSNPINGHVEAASVFIYGGNIKTSVESVLRRDNAKKLYEAIMSQVLDPSGGGESKENTPDVDKKVTFAMVDGPRVDGKKSSAIKGHRHHGVEHSHSHQLDKTQQLNHFVEQMQKMINDDPSFSDKIASFKDLIDFPLASQLNGNEINPSNPFTKALYHTYVEATKQGAASSGRAVSTLMYKNILKYAANTLTAEQKQALEADVLNYQAMSEIFSAMEAADVCVYEIGSVDLSGMVAGLNLKNKEEQTLSPEMDLLVKVYMPTLAHEIGHNLGLRHNFISTYDKANWKFHDDEASGRNYSSVMDYQVDDHNTYDGLGPQDVSALRAAYGQMLELDAENPSFKAGYDSANGVLNANGKKVAVKKVAYSPKKNVHLISLDDYQKLIGFQHWDQFETTQIADALPVHNYLFCSDEEAGLYPTCNRFDKGSTPAEIVQNIIDDQRALYSITNFKNDRLEFNYMNMGSYVGRIFSQQIRIRHFLEETIYMAIRGANKREHGTATVNDFVQATVSGLLYFNSVVSTPDVMPGTSPYNILQRFVYTQIPNSNLYARVETKWAQNMQGSSFGDYSVIGQEFDKAIALIMLTDRNIGFPRYIEASIRISYPIFETLVLNSPVEQHPTMSLLASVISNNIAPVGINPMNGAPFGLPLDFKTEATEMLRFYAVLGGIVNSDVNGQEDALNLSKHFRVYKSKDVVPNVISVAPDGVDMNSPFVDKLLASSENRISNAVVSDVYVMTESAKLQPKLKPLLVEWLKLKGHSGLLPEEKAKKQEEEVSEEEKLAALEKEIQEVLNTIPDSVVPAPLKDFSSISGVFESIMGLSAQIKAFRADVKEGNISPVLQVLYNVTDARSFEMFYVSRQNLLVQRFSKMNPLAAAVINSITVDAKKDPDLAQLLAGSNNSQHRDRVYGNLETLNMIYGILHPSDARID